MGVESANYTLIPNDGIDLVPDVLRNIGAEMREPFPSSDFERWILRGERYWIDLMVGDFGPWKKPAVSIRIALSNPMEAEEVLRGLLTTLLEQVPGRLFDSQTHRSHASMTEEAWRALRAALEKKRAEFQQYFGPFEAAISGEEVFNALHRQP